MKAALAYGLVSWLASTNVVIALSIFHGHKHLGLPHHQLERAELELRPRDNVTSTGSLSGLTIPSSDTDYFHEVRKLRHGFGSPRGKNNLSPRADADICPSKNGTTYESEARISYEIICNVDFPGNDLKFAMVSDFDSCLEECDVWNWNHHHAQCVGALFVPSRSNDADDCYLKSSVDNSVNSSGEIQGATRLKHQVKLPPSTSGSGDGSAVAPTASAKDSTAPASPIEATSVAQKSSPSASVESVTSGSDSTSIAKAPASAPSPSASTLPTSQKSNVKYASSNIVVVPHVEGTKVHGPSQNKPSSKYLDMAIPPGLNLPSSLLKPAINSDLTTEYAISPLTGVLPVNGSTESSLKALADSPTLSRDGGQGGMVNGRHVFIFCDTGSYTGTSTNKDGKFVGFVSSSVAVDVDGNGLSGQPLNLQDGIGEWSDDVGRMRGFAPLTEGEQAYNVVMQGKGQRYALWPESSIIPLDATTGLLYTPIVFDNVDMDDKEQTAFTYTGATLLTITADNEAGPIATRPVNKMFNQGEVEWGCAGGIRSWGPSGVGGDDGQVYIFGTVKQGILLARTSPAKVADRDSFEYWTGSSWSAQMLSPSSTAYIAEGAFMDIHIFYSPRHLTFMIVYLTVYADNTFYYRYLQPDAPILPAFAGGHNTGDYVENLTKYKWSEQQVLYKAPRSLSGKYIYAGAVHEGYYGDDDIINGGTKMLLSWTSPTGQDPAGMTSEYQIVTGEVEWK